MKRIYLLFCLCINIGLSYGQNMVPNGNFEYYSSCPNNYSQIANCIGWSTYTYGTPDYFNTCNNSINGWIGIPTNYKGYQQAASGNGYIGMYSDTNSREYAQCSISPLTISAYYNVSLSISRSNNCTLSMNGFGVYFYDIGPSYVNVTNGTPPASNVHISYTSYGVINDTQNWQRLDANFTADSAYDNLVIGCFISNSSMQTLPTPIPPVTYGYYYYDSVVVKRISRIYTAYTDTAICAGDTILVPYTLLDTPHFQAGNIFTAQLSDASGSFASPVNIGSRTATNAGTITAVIPPATTPGSNYKIRIRSSNLPDSSLDNDKPFKVYAYPIKPVAASNTPVCTGDSIFLSASTATTGVTWSWNGPGGFSSAQQNPKIPNAATAMAGNYIVTAAKNGCSIRDTETVVINAIPAKPVAASNTPVCAGDSLIFTATVTTPGVTWSWTGPNGFSSTLQNPYIVNVSTAASGSYIVSAILNNCPVKDTEVVLVRSLPAKPAIITNSPLCTGATLNANATTGTSGVTWSWYGPNSFSSSSQSFSITNMQLINSGSYIVTATDGNNCKNRDTANVVVNPTPAKPTVGSNAPLCSGNTLSLTASSTTNGVSWIWVGPNSWGSNQQNPSISNISTNGTGYYVATAILGSCSSKDSTQVTVNPGPTINVYANPNDSVCAGSSITLVALVTNGGTGPSYQWYKNSSIISGATNSSYNTIPANGDVYYCKFTPGAGTGCNGTINSTSIPITVLPYTTPSISITAAPDTNIWQGLMVNFTATASNCNNPAYQWKLNGNDISGATSNTWGAATLADNNLVSCVLTCNDMCPNPKNPESNKLRMHVSTGVSNINNTLSTVNIYPNPMHDELHIEGMSKGTRIQLYDVLGREVYNTTTTETTHIISTASLHTGTYILQLTDASGNRGSYKVVRE